MANPTYVMTCNDDGMGWVVVEQLLSLTNAGDLLTISGGLLAPVAAGADGQFLTADSGQSTGLMWNDMVFPGAAPTTPVAGSFYFNVSTNALNVYNGTNWVSTTLA